MASTGDHIRELAPHYLVIVVLIFAALTAVDILVPDAPFLGRAVLAIGIGLVYPIALRRSGRAPEPWR